jgi:hypothetical protein
MKGLLIAFAGESEVAKDTAALVMTELHGFVTVALADPLKRICADVFDFTDAQLWGDPRNRNIQDPRYLRGGLDVEQMYLTPRYALQQLGTSWGRNCYPHIWSEYALRVYHRLQRGDTYYDRRDGLRTMLGAGSSWMKAKTHVVISDVRYLEEIETLKRGGAFIVRIRRDPDKKSSTLTNVLASHSSEIELSTVDPNLFDDVIDNNGSLDAFKQDVDVRFRNVWLRRIEDGREEAKRASAGQETHQPA